MTSSPHKLIPAGFDPAPSLQWINNLNFAVQGTGGDQPGTQVARGHLLVSGAEPAPDLGYTSVQLEQLGFSAEAGSHLLLPSPDGVKVLLGLGDGAEVTVHTLRDAAASLVRATSKFAELELTLNQDFGLDGAVIGQVLAEGIILAAYRYTALKTDPKNVTLTAVTLRSDSLNLEELQAGWQRGLVTARATCLARDLCNDPPGHLTATNIAELAVRLGADFGFEVEVFDKAALIELGCGGILGVNAGSVEEPRLVKLTYRPASQPSAKLGFVGKGIMYDSGGISLKPSDPMHLLMKMDMGGAAAVLGAFTALADLKAPAQVTGYLACTDNLPSGSATKLGDVLRARNGKTVEVQNTDAEGRLVLMDGLSLAVEDGAEAIIDVATLTGAALMALGQSTAAVFGNSAGWTSQVLAAGELVDEPTWQLPLERKYRKQLESDVADLSNMGGRFAGATTAALFLSEFVSDVPWVHIDIAGTMNSDADEVWRPKGATGFGARTLIQAALQADAAAFA